MRDQGLNAATLAAHTGMAETALRRLLDLDASLAHPAAEAVRRLGRRVELVVEMM